MKINLYIYILTTTLMFRVFGNPSPPTLDSQKQNVANFIARRLANVTGFCPVDFVLKNKVDPIDCGDSGIITGKNACKMAVGRDRKFDSRLKFEERVNFPDAHKPQGCLYDKSSNAYVYNDISTGLGKCTSEFQCVCIEQVCKKCPHGTTGNGVTKFCSDSNQAGIIFIACFVAFCACSVLMVIAYRRQKWIKMKRLQNQQPGVPFHVQPNILFSQGTMSNEVQVQQSRNDPYSPPDVGASVSYARPIVPPDAMSPDYDGPVKPIVAPPQSLVVSSPKY
jgi:hypothetical protein